MRKMIPNIMGERNLYVPKQHVREEYCIIFFCDYGKLITMNYEHINLFEAKNI